MGLIVSASQPITLDLSALPSSSTFVAGIESGQVDNSSNLFVDAMVYVKPITGHASTAPTIGQQIQVYLWGAEQSLGTTAIDTLDGTSSTETLSHVSILRSLRAVAAPEVTVATAALSYIVQPFSVAQYFGGNMPLFWGLYVAHNHTGALGAANNNLFSYRGLKYAPN